MKGRVQKMYVLKNSLIITANRITKKIKFVDEYIPNKLASEIDNSGKTLKISRHAEKRIQKIA